MLLSKSKILLILFSLIFISSAQAVMINEISPNPPGGDPSTQTVELLGNPGASFTGVLLSIESDNVSGLGLVDRISNISGTFDVNGLLTATIDDLENPSFTLVLLDSFTGNTSTDIDTNNDGTADNTSTFGNVLDALGVADNTSDFNLLFGSELGGQDFNQTTGGNTEPELLFRDSNSLLWFAINDFDDSTSAEDINGNLVDFSSFDISPENSTFGAVNPTVVPVPAAIWFLGTALVGFFGFARKQQTI